MGRNVASSQDSAARSDFTMPRSVSTEIGITKCIKIVAPMYYEQLDGIRPKGLLTFAHLHNELTISLQHE